MHIAEVPGCGEEEAREPRRLQPDAGDPGAAAADGHHCSPHHPPTLHHGLLLVLPVLLVLVLLTIHLHSTMDNFKCWSWVDTVASHHAMSETIMLDNVM